MSKSTEIDTQAALIAGLAETMDSSAWPEDILARCQMIRTALEKIEREAERRGLGSR